MEAAEDRLVSKVQRYRCTCPHPSHVRDRWKRDQQIVQHPLRIGTHQDPYHPVTLVSRRNFSKKSCLNPPFQEKSPCLVVFKLGIHFMIFMLGSYVLANGRPYVFREVKAVVAWKSKAGHFTNGEARYHGGV
jgi:hypothetical protein